MGQQRGGSIIASYAAGNADGGADGGDYVGGLLGIQFPSSAGTYIISSYASGNADGGADGGDYVGRLLGIRGGGAGTAERFSSYGFGTLAGNEEDRDYQQGADVDGTSLPFDVTNGFAGIGNSASDLSASNAGSHWGGDNSPWSFGAGAPKLKYITGASYDSVANVVTYTCDADLLLEGVSCGDLLPGQR